MRSCYTPNRGAIISICEGFYYFWKWCTIWVQFKLQVIGRRTLDGNEKAITWWFFFSTKQWLTHKLAEREFNESIFLWFLIKAYVPTMILWIFFSYSKKPHMNSTFFFNHNYRLNLHTIEKSRRISIYYWKYQIKIDRFSDKKHQFSVTFDWTNFASSFFSHKFSCQPFYGVYNSMQNGLNECGVRNAVKGGDWFLLIFILHTKDNTISVAWANFYP